MTAKYYVDQFGNYIGGFDGVEPPIGSIEIPEPPIDGRHILVEGIWTFPSYLIKEELINAVQSYMDKSAKALGYDDIKSAITYAEEPSVAKFQIEGQAFRAWRSLCWAKCYEVMLEVESGNRSIPTKSELVAELPALQINY